MPVSGVPVTGSPPRMRGKGRDPGGFRRSGGITPACAGKSSERMQKSGTNGDHPRVCGEKKVAGLTFEAKDGSPPRMRGKVAPVGAWHAFVRITPAYAGKRQSSAPRWTPARDHPRVCGEKRGLILRITWLQGSPPRMRGKGASSVWSLTFHGITPAYAGKRPSRSRSAADAGDHPRVCGEKFWL